MFQALSLTEKRWIACAGLLLIGAALVPSQQISLWLLHDTDHASFASVTHGASLLKLFLAIDGVLILLCLIFKRKAGHQHQSVYQALWHPSVSDESGMSSRTLHLSIALILVVAAVLRFYKLDTDLWIDEVLTLVNYVRLPLGSVVTSFQDDNQHLLFSSLARISVVVFGESAWALRLPAVLAGIASIWMTAHLAHYVFGGRVAILSALILCVSWHHIWYSQNARGYTLLLLGTLCATWYLLKALQHGYWRYWLLYAVFMAMSLMSHLSAVFIGIAHAAVVMALLLIRVRVLGDGCRPAVGFLLSAWLSLHAYALMLPQIHQFFFLAEANKARLDNPWRNPLWLVNETLSSLGIPLQLEWAHLLLGLALAVLLAWIFRRKSWVFLVLTVLPGVVLGLAMVLLDRNLWPRLFFNLAGFIVIFMALCCFMAGSFAARLFNQQRSWFTWIPGVLIGLFFLQSMFSLYRYPKQDFTGARDFVQQNAKSADAVLGIHMAGKMNQLYYQPSWQVIESLADLNTARSSSADTWIIYTLPRYLKTSRPELYQELMLNSEFMREFPGTLGDGNLIVRRFNRKPPVHP